MNEFIKIVPADDKAPVLALGRYKLTKFAYSPVSRVAEALKDLKPSNKIYVIAAPVGAGETWGPNSWGDYFPREELIKYAKTFEQYANIYVGHNNSSPDYAVGKVLVSDFNPETDRIDLLFEINPALLEERAPSWAKEAVNAFIEGDQMLKLSMGCKAEYDECSVCGKTNKSRTEYCDHLKYYMNEFYNGKQVYAITYGPVFFDLSIVQNPADPVALGFKSMLFKTASNDRRTYNQIRAANPEVNLKFESLSALGSLYYHNDEFLKIAQYYVSKIGLDDFIKASKVAGMLLSYKEIQKLYGNTPTGIYKPRLHFFEPDERLIKIATELKYYQGLRPPKPAGKMLKSISAAWAAYLALTPSKALVGEQLQPETVETVKYAFYSPFAYVELVDYNDNRSSYKPILELILSI
ncbi:MAG: hypothetical protein QXQ37_06270 [Nitrososphaerota archaeon]